MTIKDKTVRLCELVGDDDAIRDTDFHGCEIKGPAVIAPLDHTAFYSPRWLGDLDSIIWEVPPDRPVIGVIAVRNCRFYACRFVNVGIASIPEMAAKLRASVAGSS